MKDEIFTYWEMCSRQAMSLQRGMYFRPPPAHGVILMSRRPNAPYDDTMSPDESVLKYEGHDVQRNKDVQDPKAVDQPRLNVDGRSTENGRFADWVDGCKRGKGDSAVFRVYEKMRAGIWTDRGLYLLKDYSYLPVDERRVFKFRFEQAGYDTSGSSESSEVGATVSRQIPSWIKQQVFKRDKGRCVMCGSTEQLHFDHDLPFSKGGTSVLPQNVRILCARHNLAKSAKIE